MKHITFATLLAAGLLAGAAQAQGIGAKDIPGPPPAAAENVMGGGGAVISGGGDNMVITRSGGGGGAGRILAQVPRLARAQNTTTGGISVEYLETERAPAGAEAWMTGGGDNAEVVYVRPR